MAYTAGNLHLRAGAPGSMYYHYNATSTGADDTLAEIIVAGYFDNADDDLNLVVGDTIWCRCSDGNMNVVVSSISSDAVTCQFAGGNLPTQTGGSGTGACDARLLVGQYELGSGTSANAGQGTSTHWMLPTPYPGAEVKVRLDCSMVTSRHFDCGGNTNVELDRRGNRRIVLTHEGDSFHVVGVSTTRWRILDLKIIGTDGDTSFLNGCSLSILTSTHI